MTPAALIGLGCALLVLWLWWPSWRDVRKERSTAEEWEAEERRKADCLDNNPPNH